MTAKKNDEPPEQKAFPQGHMFVAMSCQVPRPKAHPPWALGFQPPRNLTRLEPIELHTPISVHRVSPPPGETLFLLRIANFKLQIADHGNKNGRDRPCLPFNLQSEICNLKSAICDLQF